MYGVLKGDDGEFNGLIEELSAISPSRQERDDGKTGQSERPRWYAKVDDLCLDIESSFN